LKRLLIFFGIITVFIVAWVVITYLTTARNQSTALMEQATEKADNQLSKFFDPVISAATIFKGWAESGKFNHFSAGTINAMVIPLLAQLPQVHSLEVSDEKQLRYLLQRDDKGWMVYENFSTADRKPASMWSRLGPDGAKKESWPADQTVMTEKRQWLKEVLTAKQQGPSWAGPHRLPLVDKSAVSAVVRWEQNNGPHVVAFDIRESDIRQQLESLSFTASSRIFLFGDGRVFSASGWQQKEASVAGGQDSKDEFEPVFLQALKAWRERKGAPDPFRFQVGKTFWWAQLMRFKGAGEKNDGMGIVVPEKELLALQQGAGYLYIIAALAVLWIGLLVFSRKYLRESARQRSVVDVGHIPEEAVRRMIAAGESERLEFKSTLRWNLKADRAGKEIELACLKTVAAFMNSDGGTLLVGVADDGTVTGTEADGFENDDKYLQHFSNIFKQHIGLAFSEHVEFALRPVGDRQVLVVTCRKSPRPVFLKNKQDEHFYIRSGPSSRDLTPSQMLDYVAKRFA
jgi:hypothetical protein